MGRRHRNRKNKKSKPSKLFQQPPKPEDWSTNPCFCCSSFSREADDVQVLNLVYPLVAKEEFNTLPWGKGETLPLLDPEKHGKLDSYYLLKPIFLCFFDTNTLLSLRGVCKAWNALVDIHPAWKYLLPLRNEIVPILKEMKWGDYRSSPDSKGPLFEREYFINPKDGERHYRLKVAESHREKLAAKKGKSGETRCCHCSSIDLDCCHCCDSSDCCGNCSISSCSCPGSSDDEYEDEARRNQHRVLFGAECNKSEFLLGLKSEQEKDLAEIAHVRRQRVIDWHARLLARRKKGDDNNNNNKNKKKQQQKEDEKGNPLLGAAEPDVVLPSALADIDDESEKEPTYEPDDEGEDDDDDDDAGTDDDNVFPFPLHKPQKKSQKKSQKKMPKGNKPKLSSQFLLSGVAASQPVMDEIDDEQDPDDDDTDTDSDNEDGSFSQQNSYPVVDAFGAASKDSENDSENNNNNDGDELLTPTAMGDRQETLNPESPIAPRIHFFVLQNINPRTLVDGFELVPKPYNVRVRARHTTLKDNAEKIAGGLSYRREWTFPSFSAFAHTVDELLQKQKQYDQLSWWDRHGGLISLGIVHFLMFCLLVSIGALLGYYFDRTVFENGTDNVLQRNVAAITTTILVVYGGITLAVSFIKFDDNNYKASMMKSMTMHAWLVALTVFSSCVLASLLSRVNVTESLLASGSVSVCDAWNSIDTGLAGSTTKAGNVPYKSGQCQLPPSVLPEKLAWATFLHFPVGTKILYHPPNISRTVPFAATRPANTTGTCTLKRDQLVSPVDQGFQNAKYVIRRGRIGYYTVIFPASCSSSNGIKNVTVLILGDYSSCPFWSSRESAKNISSYSGTTLKYTFKPVLDVNTNTDAVNQANLISSELGSAVSALSSSSAGAGTGLCQWSTNSMVTVKSSSADGNHGFYLRISRSFHSHYSSYFTYIRQPYYLQKYSRYKSSNGHKGPWETYKNWPSTLEYQMNGILALMADEGIFFSHFNKASPIEPQELYSPFSNQATTPSGDSIVNGDTKTVSWQDSGMSPFWSQAHPAGLRRLSNDFKQGALIFALVVGIFVFLLLCVFAPIASSWVRGTLWTTGLVSMAIMVIPLPVLIHSIICFVHSPEFDSGELRVPVACLAASQIDAIGPLIYSSVIVGIPVFILIIVCIISCAANSECCEQCCSKLCSCIGDCCDKCCGCCESCDCCSCPDCCSDCCSEIGKCCDKMCDCIGNNCCCCCDDCSDCCDNCCDNCEKCVDKLARCCPD